MESAGVGVRPSVMLSGFESKAEKNIALKIILQLGGRYIVHYINSQAFVMSCTHVICTKPSRREKYLAACASGKWILKAQYLCDCAKAKKWLPEADYQWSASDAPRAEENDLAIGLYSAPQRWRNLIAGDGNRRPFIGWKVGLVMEPSYASAFSRILEAGGAKTLDITASCVGGVDPPGSYEEGSVTHVLVSVGYQAMLRLRPELRDVPHLRSSYVTSLLANETPPKVEEYTLLQIPDAESASVKCSTPSKRPAAEPAVASTPKKLALNPELDKSMTPERPTQLAVKSKPGAVNPEKSNNIGKPLPAQFISRNMLSLSSSSPIRIGTAGHKSQPWPSSNSVQGGIKKYFEVVPPTKVAIVKVKKKMATPTISLAPERKDSVVATPMSRVISEPARKPADRLFSNQFLETHRDLVGCFAAEKKHMMSYRGILDNIILPSEYRPFNDPLKNPRSISSERMSVLEGTLDEVKCGRLYFLNELRHEIQPDTYPPPDILYFVMKVLLLDSDDYAISVFAHKVLLKMSVVHHPQAKHVKTQKLYHKAFAAVTKPIMNEATFLTQHGHLLSDKNDENWKDWTLRDSTLGVHWSFYSRVFKIAVQKIPLHDPGEDVAAVPLRMTNAALLSDFLANIVFKDYQDVAMRKRYPPHCLMIKCLIADLLWPDMTGLEPWFRRTSANLADLASLYVEAVERYREWEIYSENNNQPCNDIEDHRRNVLKNIGRIVATTASWCVLCHLHDKEQAKRTSARTLESELISVFCNLLTSKTFDVIEVALQHLPCRTRLKLAVAMLQHNSVGALVKADKDAAEDVSLKTIASHFMMSIPTVQSGQDNQTRASDSIGSQSWNQANPNRTAESALLSKLMKQNHKGETPLHIACIRNQPDKVRCLINQTGVRPNMQDFAGWTALGEACLRGHVECVKTLLTLPMKPLSDNSKKDVYEVDPDASDIDLTLCPSDGQTPLHDALTNNHFEVACMLLKKGGVKLLDIKNSKKLSPLDCCADNNTKKSIQQYASDVAAQSQKSWVFNESSDAILMQLPSPDMYEKIVRGTSSSPAQGWRQRVVWWSNLMSFLIREYATHSGLLVAARIVDIPELWDEQSREHGSTLLEMTDYANEMIYCYRWRECWGTYSDHLRRLLGAGNVSGVVADVDSPIPFDLLPGEVQET